MTSIAAAPISGITNPDEHPAWCAMAHVNFEGKPFPCGDHLGETADIPATDSDMRVIDNGALFPRLEVAPTTDNGQIAVYLALFVPTGDDSAWASVNLLPSDARKLAADLTLFSKDVVVASADRASYEMTVSATGLNGSVSAATDGGSVRVTVVGDKSRALEAFLKSSEVELMMFGLRRAADEVEGLWSRTR